MAELGELRKNVVTRCLSAERLASSGRCTGVNGIVGRTGLLGSLAAPLKARLVLLGVVVVVSTAGTVAGPALIAWGIDNALPRVMDENDWVPAFGVVATYIVVAVLGAVLTAWYTVLAARISQAILFDLRRSSGSR